MKAYDYTNGQAVSEIIKEEIEKFIEEYCNKYPNDASLGEAIRKLQQ
tara:strand:- start:298 stop:438 length:141 start_codon:yes stop_codon:yes gene_type:complete